MPLYLIRNRPSYANLYNSKLITTMWHFYLDSKLSFLYRPDFLLSKPLFPEWRITYEQSQ